MHVINMDACYLQTRTYRLVPMPDCPKAALAKLNSVSRALTLCIKLHAIQMRAMSRTHIVGGVHFAAEHIPWYSRSMFLGGRL